jgi:nicotinamide phosphoribosyltransferase
MYKINPMLAIDSYKLSHMTQYPENSTKVYCNLTARSFNHIEKQFPKGFFNKKAVVFGLSSSIQEVVESFQEEFFDKPLEPFLEEFKAIVRPFIGDNSDEILIENITKLHELGYLPLEFKILPEGTEVGANIPMMTWTNTHDDFAWLPNYLETFLSSQTWKLSTCATIAKVYRNIFDHFAKKTGVASEFVDFQGHDFSSRGMSGTIDAGRCGSAHLTSFKGSDAVLSVPYINKYYNSNGETPFVAGSVPATEHSVCCLGVEEYIKEIKKEISEL